MPSRQENKGDCFWTGEQENKGGMGYFWTGEQENIRLK